MRAIRPDDAALRSRLLLADVSSQSATRSHHFSSRRSGAAPGSWPTCLIAASSWSSGWAWPR